MNKKQKRSLSPEVKKGNRVVDLIQKDFCDVKDKNSSTIASSKSTTTATSLNHVASDNGGKHIEDRICRKTEKTLKTEAAELKYYFETTGSPERISRSRGASKLGSREMRTGNLTSVESILGNPGDLEINVSDNIKRLKIENRTPNARIGGSDNIPIKILGTTQITGCQGDFCDFDMDYLSDKNTTTIATSLGKNDKSLSEFRKRLITSSNSSDFILKDSVLSSLLHNDPATISSSSATTTTTTTNVIGNNMNGKTILEPLHKHTTTTTTPKIMQKITYRSIIQARQEMPLVKLQLERHRKNEIAPYVREESYSDMAVAGKLPAHYYQEVPCCVNCYKIYKIVDEARNKALKHIASKKSNTNNSIDSSYTDDNSLHENSMELILTSYQKEQLKLINDQSKERKQRLDIKNNNNSSTNDSITTIRTKETLDAAIQAIGSLTKMDVAEIRTMAKPHAAVEVVMEAVLALLIGKVLPFKEAHKLLAGGESFLNMLKDFDISQVTEARLRLVEPYVDNPLFRPENVQPISLCASKFCAWVHGIVHAVRLDKGLSHKRTDILQPLQYHSSNSMELIKSDPMMIPSKSIQQHGVTKFNRGEYGNNNNKATTNIEELTFVQKLEKIKASKAANTTAISRNDTDHTGSSTNYKTKSKNGTTLKSVSRSLEQFDKGPTNSLLQSSSILSSDSTLLTRSMTRLDPGPAPSLYGGSSILSVTGGSLVEELSAKKLSKREAKAVSTMQKKATDRLSSLSVTEGGAGVIGSPKIFRCSDGITKMPYVVLGSFSLNVTRCSFIVIHDFFDTCDATAIMFKPIVQRHEGCQVFSFNYPGQAHTVWPRLSAAEKELGARDPIINNDWIADRLDELLQHAEQQGDILLTNPFHLVGIGNGACIAAAFCQRWGRTKTYEKGLRSVVSINGFLYPDPQLSSILHSSYQVFESSPHSRPDIPISYWCRFVFSEDYLSKINPNLALNIYTAVSNPITNDGRAKITRGCLQHRDMRGALSPDYKPIRSNSVNQNQLLPIQVPVIILQATENALVNASNVDSFLQGRNSKHLWSHMLNVPSEVLMNNTADTTAVWVGKLSTGPSDYHKCSTLGKAGLKMILESLRSPRGAFSMWTRTGHAVNQEYKAAVLDLIDVLACPTDEYVGIDVAYEASAAVTKQQTLLAMTNSNKLEDNTSSISESSSQKLAKQLSQETSPPKVEVIFEIKSPSAIDNKPSNAVNMLKKTVSFNNITPVDMINDKEAENIIDDENVNIENLNSSISDEATVQELLKNLGYTKPHVVDRIDNNSDDIQDQKDVDEIIPNIINEDILQDNPLEDAVTIEVTNISSQPLTNLEEESVVNDLIVKASPKNKDTLIFSHPHTPNVEFVSVDDFLSEQEGFERLFHEQNQKHQLKPQSPIRESSRPSTSTITSTAAVVVTNNNNNNSTTTTQIATTTTTGPPGVNMQGLYAMQPPVLPQFASKPSTTSNKTTGFAIPNVIVVNEDKVRGNDNGGDISQDDHTGVKLIKGLKEGLEHTYLSTNKQKEVHEWTKVVPDAITALELEIELKQKQKEYFELEDKLKRMRENENNERLNRIDQAQDSRRKAYQEEDHKLLSKLKSELDTRQRERDFTEKQRRIEAQIVEKSLVESGLIPAVFNYDNTTNSNNSNTNSHTMQRPIQEMIPLRYEDPGDLPVALREGMDILSKLDRMKEDEEQARKRGTLSVEDYEQVKRNMAERQMQRDEMLRNLSNAEKEELFIACVIKMQMIVRGRIGRNKAKNALTRRKFYLLQVKMAIKIQSLARGIIGRKRFNRIKDLYLNNLKNAYSATEVQRVFRGYVARKYFKKVLRWMSAIRIQKTFRGHIGKLAFQREKRRLDLINAKHRNAAKIQSIWRMKVAKEEFRSLRIHILAAIELQRMYRGYLGRKLMSRKRLWESTAAGPDRIKLGLEFIEESKQAFERQQEELDALHRAQERAEARVSHIHAELTESEKELIVLERELQEIDQIERDLNILTQERDLLNQGIENAAGMPRIASKGQSEVVLGKESTKDNDPIHDRRRKAEAYALEMTIQIKRSEREKKRQELELEFAAVFQEVEKKKKALERLELSLSDMEATRERKDREFHRLQKNLMQLLMEQKQELDDLREKGIELETATATTAAAAVATAQKAKEHEQRSTAMFSQTEELMKFQFMSMSLSYFSSLNMLKSLRDMNADTTSAAIALSSDASSTAASIAAAANLPNMKKLNLGGNDFMEGHIHKKKAELAASQEAEKEFHKSANNPIPDNVRSWTVSDVARWLDSLTLGQYCHAFTEGSVDGPFLMELREEDLVQVLGIKHKLHVRKILISREKLKPLNLQELKNKEVVETEERANKTRNEIGIPTLDTVFSQARNGRVKRVEESLNTGFPIDAEDEKGNTLLLVATQNSNKKLVEMLLVRGANINHQNALGNTALHFALTFDTEGTLGEYLIEHGADDTIENVSGYTPYDGASV